MENLKKEREYEEIRKLREMGYSDDQIKDLIILAIEIERRTREKKEEM